MKSIILCEGKDDLWFIAYYLHKTAGWDICKNPKSYWHTYAVSPLDNTQAVKYLAKGEDCVAIWSVSGKDRLCDAVGIIRDKFIAEYPFDIPASIVIMRDRDNDDEGTVLRAMESWFSGKVTLENKRCSTFCESVDDIDVSIAITPLIIPFAEDGAIETILMGAIRESGAEGNTITAEANNYIDRLLKSQRLGNKYLRQARQVLKARYSAVIAVTNPDHSTELFQEMVMDCPWEESEYVKDHFNVILKSITHHT